MLIATGHSFILRRGHLNNKVMATGVSRFVKVSDGVIRKNPQQSEAKGNIIKVQGGMLSFISTRASYAPGGDMVTSGKEPFHEKRCLNILII